MRPASRPWYCAYLRSIREKRPAFALTSPSRLRRIRSRIVAPMPPALTKPSPNAPAAKTGSFDCSLPETSVAAPISARSSSTALARPSRSARSSSRIRSSLLVVAILQRLRRQPGFLDRLLRNGRRRLRHGRDADEAEHAGDHEQDAGDDQQREPHRHGGGQRGRDRREREAEHEEQEDRGADEESDADPEGGRLPLQLRECELDLEVDDRADALADRLRGGPQAPFACAGLTSVGGHGLSNRSISRGPLRSRARRRRR